MTSEKALFHQNNADARQLMLEFREEEIEMEEVEEEKPKQDLSLSLFD